ncbi:MAG: hypothetical protein U5K75_09725 [Ahrensia sp.]|nr:hypothetical protein [Ahrensia sp.]
MNRHRIFAMVFLGLASSFALQGCAAIAVADAAVSSTVFVAKTAVKGTVGAGKLVYRGGKAVAGIGRSDDERYYSSGSSGGSDSSDSAGPSCLNADGSYSPAPADASGTYFCP